MCDKNRVSKARYCPLTTNEKCSGMKGNGLVWCDLRGSIGGNAAGLTPERRRSQMRRRGKDLVVDDNLALSIIRELVA